jgi:hypothetical protein
MKRRVTRGIVRAVRPDRSHKQLCTIELIAEGHAERCPGEECPFWERGCALTRIEYELDGRPDVARLLLDLRRELEAGRELDVEEVHARFAHILNEDEGILEPSAREDAGRPPTDAE